MCAAMSLPGGPKRTRSTATDAAVAAAAAASTSGACLREATMVLTTSPCTSPVAGRGRTTAAHPGERDGHSPLDDASASLTAA